MNARFPNYLKFAVLAESGGIILLILSLNASKPPAYLFTLGAGATLLLIGLLGFLFFFKQALSGKVDVDPE